MNVPDQGQAANMNVPDQGQGGIRSERKPHSFARQLDEPLFHGLLTIQQGLWIAQCAQAPLRHMPQEVADIEPRIRSSGFDRKTALLSSNMLVSILRAYVSISR